jgi:uncharacterized protein YndB with AHSA1/START domain
MRSLTRGYHQGFETAASSATLWRALVEPEALALWYATDAVVEPRVGGRYFAVSRLFGRREAHIERFEPGVRLQLAFDPSPGWPPLTESVLMEDFIIDARKEQRVLRVMGSGIPADTEWATALKRLRAGWAIAFAMLQKRLLAGEIREAAG